ncbi:helix-turn-helix domain-containing protein [Streptomyces sp. NPDC094032]|uniref:AraC family transcriptional regulator n=1 Tax=Streptomyces sp. NPDC094032 TaxID=3155308 RepID=UPI0033172B0F
MPTYTRGATAWDIARPQRPSRVPGLTMAGFGIRELDTLRMVPHPAVTLILEFGAGSPVVESASGERQQGCVAAGTGAGSRGAIQASGKNIECVQVRLSPVIARAVLGVPLADLDGAIVPLDALWGREAPRIRERLADTTSWQQRFALTDALLARRYAAQRPVDKEIAWAWHRIATTHGRTRVDALATETGWTRKRLWSRFHVQLGLPPKQAIKLIRFDHAAHRLLAGVPAARVAAESGYADQSHLHRDVMTYTGRTPATVSAEPFLAVDDIAWPN